MQGVVGGGERKENENRIGKERRYWKDMRIFSPSLPFGLLTILRQLEYSGGKFPFPQFFQIGNQKRKIVHV